MWQIWFLLIVRTAVITGSVQLWSMPSAICEWTPLLSWDILTAEGIAHLMTDAGKDKNEFLSIWMRVAQDARAQADARCPDASAEQRERACEQWAIRLSLRNLRSFPWIRTAEIRGELGIHGWYFDLASGTLLQFDEGSELFIPLGDSYANEASETETAE